MKLVFYYNLYDHELTGNCYFKQIVLSASKIQSGFWCLDSGERVKILCDTLGFVKC